MSDPYATWSSDDLVTQARRGVPITASADAFTPTRAIHCNEAGSITVDFAEGAAGVVLTVTAGAVYPYRIVKVTAGLGVVALY